MTKAVMLFCGQKHGFSGMTRGAHPGNQTGPSAGARPTTMTRKPGGFVNVWTLGRAVVSIRV